MVYFFSLLLLALGGWVWTYGVEPNWFRLRRQTLRLKKPLREPLTILHLSDLHLSKERFFLKRFFDRLATLEVDFVFLTGDFIDHSRGIEPCVNHLKKLRPKRGVYAVLGNHDYQSYSSFDSLKWVFTRTVKLTPRPESEVAQLKRGLREAGIHLLSNESISVPLRGGEEIVVVGIDDPITGRADLNVAFRGIENGVLHLALSHSPRPFPVLANKGIDVAFSGHTHGGQVRLPRIGPLPFIRVINPIIDSTDRFGFFGIVSRGMGAKAPEHFRFLCRPEALLIRIEGSPARP